MTKEELLKKFYGHSAFRTGQDELIEKIMSGSDVLGVMPTGAGKSVCYQIPALMLDGLTIVVSPLISLMEDQVTALRQMGINAAFLNSTLNGEEYMRTIDGMQSGCYKIIYVAPERLLTDGFLRAAGAVEISMVTVDEAHCVSQWGQDFRPSYMDIPSFIDKLQYRPIVSAFTATATPEVKKDICSMLRLNSPFVLTTGFDRKNLYFAVKTPKDKYVTLKGIVDKHRDKFGIIYCSTRRYVEEICKKLNDDGYSATRYHAGLDDSERRQNQEDFVYDRKQVMVATNAFGMGIDKSNVSYVIHYNMPKSLESYYQEAGRAGRDGSYSECTVLYAKSDVRMNRFMIDKSDENSNLDEETREVLREKDYERLKQMTFYCTIKSCLRNFILRYFGEKSSNECGNCSNCLGDFENFDITIDTQKIISCVYRAKESCTRAEIIHILNGTDENHTELSTYGIMKNTDKRDIDDVIGYLLEIKLLREYEGLLVLTENANSFIKERRTLFRKVQTKAPQAVAVAPKTELVAVDERLLLRLKELRGSLAKIQSVPAYVVFTDMSLRDMCAKLPKTKEEFLGVSGVGSAKCERYGEKFLFAIRKYLDENSKLSF